MRPQTCVTPLGGSRHGKQRRLRPLLVTPFFGRQLPDGSELRRFSLGCFAQTALSLSFSFLLAYALLYLLCSALLSFAWHGLLCFALPRSTTLHFALPRVVLPCLALLCSTSSLCLALLSRRVLLRSAHTTPVFEAARYLAALSCLGICALSTQQRTGDGSSRGAVADPISPSGGDWGRVQLNAAPRARKQLPARGRRILQALLLATLSEH